MTQQALVPPFDMESAARKVQVAQDLWNTRDPQKVALGYTEDSEWRNRDEFLHGRAEIVAFLERKWARELDYRLRKQLWTAHENRIAVHFEYECQCGRPVVPLVWRRAVGVRAGRTHAPTSRQHQRSGDHRGRAPTPLSVWRSFRLHGNTSGLRASIRRLLEYWLR